jgi:hypothetical protein
VLTPGVIAPCSVPRPGRTHLDQDVPGVSATRPAMSSTPILQAAARPGTASTMAASS